MFFGTFFSYSQNILKRYLNSLLNDTTDIANPKFIFYPTIAYSPETNWEIGFSPLYVYYANRDTTNRLSEINGFTFITLEQQYGLWIDHAIYTQGNRWFFLGRTRLQSFPLQYYGIGNNTSSEALAKVDADQIYLKQRALRQIIPNLFFGLELDLQRFTGVSFDSRSEDTPLVLPLGAQGSTNFGVGLGMVYDNRHNILNVRKGFFSELAFLRYDGLWGSRYNFNSWISDTRWYRPLGEHNVIAGQFFGQFTQGDVPFNQLALLGGESIMRGYYLGRYRDRNMVATQLEVRFLPLPLGFTDRFGLAVFGSVGQVFNQLKSFDINHLAWAGGVGGRFLLFPNKDIYTRLDFAFTSEGTGYYLFIGEAF